MGLCHPPNHATLVYHDNVSVAYLSSNLVQHQWTKHVETDLHFVWERLTLGHIQVLHVRTTSLYTDIFIKGLPTSVFQEFRFSLNVRHAPDQTVGEC